MEKCGQEQVRGLFVRFSLVSASRLHAEDRWGEAAGWWDRKAGT